MAEFAKAFITGCPIDHALSPAIHHYWLQFYNLKGSYEAILTGVESFPRFLADMGQKGFCGGAIAPPHKETALSLTARPSAAAQGIGAVNFVWLEGAALCGGNSDWQGFTANLDAACGDWAGDAALVLGMGGTVRAVIYALLKRGFRRIILANRVRDKAAKLAEFFGRAARVKIELCSLDDVNACLPQVALLVNSGALGALPAAAMPPSAGGDFPQQEDEAETALKPFGFIDFRRLPGGAAAADCVYAAAPTAFLQAAAAAGLKTADGLGMLLRQAAVGFEQWFGARPEVTEELRNYIIGKAAG